MAKLTKRTVDAAQPRDKRYTLFDDALTGFGLRVFPSGKMSWVIEYKPRAGGGTRRYTFKEDPNQLAPDQARNKAKKLLGMVANGGDPSADLSEERKAITVKELARLFIAEHVEPKRRERTASFYSDILNRIVVPEIGSAKAGKVQPSDVARLHLKWKRTPTQANRILSTGSSMYGFAARQGLVPKDCNPFRGIERYPEEGRESFLTTEQLERFGAALTEAETIGVPWAIDESKPTSKHVPKKVRLTKLGPHAAAALRLLIFTGCRRGEILNLRWSEVDLERGLLFLPTSKSGKKTVVLNTAAMTVLAELPKVGEYVVAGDGEGPRRDLKRPWQAVAKRAGLDGIRLHDLRHTFASYGAAGGHGLPVVGKLLGHTQARTTQRYVHLDSDPLRRASDRIADTIAAAMKGQPKGEVVDLERRRG